MVLRLARRDEIEIESGFRHVSKRQWQLRRWGDIAFR
jgi:hypothetical protein